MPTIAVRPLMPLFNNNRQRHWIIVQNLLLPGLVLSAILAFSPTVLAQPGNENAEPDTAAALPQPFKQATYGSQPILLHLPTGFARAIILPEPVILKSPADQLPGCAVEIEGKVIGLYATKTFDRRPILFEGVETGLIYEFHIRASEKGIKEPLQINR